MTNYHHWTPDEDNTLKRLVVGNKTFTFIAILLGRSKNSCIGRWNRLNDYQRWPEKPRRPKAIEIKTKLSKIDNRLTPKNKDLWAKEDDVELLKLRSLNIRFCDIAKIISRSQWSVTQQYKKLTGYKPTPKPDKYDESNLTERWADRKK